MAYTVLARRYRSQSFDDVVGQDAVAHTFLSFGFSDGRYLSVSVEIRPEVGESYGMLDGFFKQYELIYIWGDERDLVRTRTNYWNEDAYLYRSSLSEDKIQRLFISMLERTNSLYKNPEFYNTLTESCTSSVAIPIRRRSRSSTTSRVRASIWSTPR